MILDGDYQASACYLLSGIIQHKIIGEPEHYGWNIIGHCVTTSIQNNK